MTWSSKHKVKLLFDGQYRNATLEVEQTSVQPCATHVKPPIDGGTEKAEQENAITALTSLGMMEEKREGLLPV